MLIYFGRFSLLETHDTTNRQCRSTPSQRSRPALAGRAHGLVRRHHHQAVVHHYGRDEFLQRLSHPFWFQSFGAVMGMDWHSSGITTSVIGALKRGLTPLQGELGIYVCGGRGKHSRRTPDELAAIGEQTGLDGQALTRAMVRYARSRRKPSMSTISASSK